MWAAVRSTGNYSWAVWEKSEFVRLPIRSYLPDDLTHGKLQALQVSINGSPVVFVPFSMEHPTGDVLSDNQLLLHTVGASWPVQWITIHDTAVDGTGAFDANARAKLLGATPFKRPENAQFQPGSNFQTFFFVITGDTDNRAGIQPVLAARGAWGGIFRVDLDASREMATSLSSFSATPTMLRLIILPSWMTRTRSW